MTRADPTHRIQPSDETLTHWAHTLLPDLDVWFWDGSDLVSNATRCLVMSREDYLRHPTFREIRYVNAYLHWRIPPEVTRVIVSGPAWITSIAPPDRQRILGKQVELQRGLVLPRAWFGDFPDALESFVIHEQVVLCHAAWRSVPEKGRRTALLAEQRRWDDVDCFPIPTDMPAHIRAIANTFRRRDGANCLGVTAYCITSEDWMRHHWMFQPEFHDLITRHGYRPVAQEPPASGDVVAFEADGRIVHAAFCVGDDRFLNKNGQSRFNPVRVVDWASLAAGWQTATWVTYRQVRALAR